MALNLRSANFKRFKHNDRHFSHTEQQSCILIPTELRPKVWFSMDGDKLRYRTRIIVISIMPGLMVDDAHGFGHLGSKA